MSLINVKKIVAVIMSVLSCFHQGLGTFKEVKAGPVIEPPNMSSVPSGTNEIRKWQEIFRVNIKLHWMPYSAVIKSADVHTLVPLQ